MSDILKTFFSNKSIYNGSTKNLSSNKEKVKLINCGLVLSERNIFKIKDSKYQILKTIDINNYKKTDLFSNSLIQKKFKDNKNLDEYRLNNLHFFNNFTNYNKKRKIIFRNNDDKNKINNYQYIKNKEQTFNHKLFKKKENEIIYSYLNEKSDKNNEKLVTLFNNNEKAKTISYDSNKSKYSSNSKLYKAKKNNHHNTYFPKEKQINLKSYLDYELKSEPNNVNKFKCIDALIKRLKNKKDYKEKLMNNIIESNKHKYYIDKLKINYKSRENNTNYLKNKDKKYSPNYRKRNKNKFDFNIFNSNYKKNIDNSIGKTNKNKIKNKIYTIEKYNKDINLISFDEKMNKAISSTNKTINYINNLSGKNEELIKKINTLYNKKYIDV